MRDFEKQVKKLRYCSKPGNCNLQCPRFSFAEDCLGKLTTDAADAIEELQASLLKWYSVSEPPKRNGRYLVAYEDSVSFLDYFNGKWFFPPRNGIVVEETKESVLYWMPMPEPPKEGLNKNVE